MEDLYVLQFNTDIDQYFQYIYTYIHSALMMISASSLRLSLIRKEPPALCLTAAEHVNEVSLSAILSEDKMKVLLTVFVLLNTVEEIVNLLSLLLLYYCLCTK